MLGILFLVTVLVSPMILVGQGQDSQLTPPAKRKFKYNGKIDTTYDQSKDQSMVFFKLIPIKALETPKGPDEIDFSDERLELTSFFAYPGKDLATPNWVTLGFLSATADPQKYSNQKLSVKIDGKWTDLGAMKVLTKTSYARSGELPIVRETKELAVPYQQFLMLANAKKVKVKLGTVEFDFEQQHLEAIRDLAAHTVP